MESNLDYFVKINSLDRNEPTLKFSEKSELIFGEAKGQQQYPGAQFAENGSRNEGLTPTMTPASQPTLITDEHSPRRNLAVVSSKVKSVGVSEAIKHQNTNILSVEAGIVVQQVNRQGVMGAGLAKQFSDRYPDLLPQYREQLDSGRLKLGGVFFLRQAIACLLPTLPPRRV